MAILPRTTLRHFSIPDAFWHGLRLIELEAAVVLRQAKLPVTLNMKGGQGQHHVTTEEFFRIWEAVRTLNPDPAAGILLSTRLDTVKLPPSSFTAFIARDYRDGLQRLARFKQLCAPEKMLITEKDRVCTITIDWWHAFGAIPRLLTDAAFASFVELGRRATGVRIVPHHVELTAQDDGSGTHAEYFGCPIHFGANKNALVLDVADLDRPFSGHNPELLNMLNPALSSALAEVLSPHTISQQVKAALKRILPSGRPDVARVAKEIGMSVRTLQRRITDESTSFRQLLLETRQEMMCHLLKEPSISIDEVAYLLGYEDTNSFYRAFRSWEGTTPSRWRISQANLA